MIVIPEFGRLRQDLEFQIILGNIRRLSENKQTEGRRTGEDDVQE